MYTEQKNHREQARSPKWRDMALRIVLHSDKKELTFSPLGLDHYAFRSRDARRPDHSMRNTTRQSATGQSGKEPPENGEASRCTVKRINARECPAAGPNT